MPTVLDEFFLWIGFGRPYLVNLGGVRGCAGATPVVFPPELRQTAPNSGR